MNRMFLFLLPCIFATVVLETTFQDLELTISETFDFQFEFEVKYTPANGAQLGWFAVGFPNPTNLGVSGMVGTTAFVATDHGVHKYDIQQKSQLQQSWRLAENVGTVSWLGDYAVMSFVVADLTGVDQLVFAYNAQGATDPETGSNCFHEGNKGVVDVTLDIPTYLVKELEPVADYTVDIARNAKGLQFSVTRSNVGTSDGWFALGHPDPDRSLFTNWMQGTFAVIYTNEGVKAYDIVDQTVMSPSWAATEYLTDVQTFEEGTTRAMKFTIVGLTTAEVTTLVYAYNKNGQWDPEGASNCYHGPENKGAYDVLLESFPMESEFFFINLQAPFETAVHTAKITTAVGLNKVTYNGVTTLLANAGDSMEIENFPFGGVVTTSKPAGVTGKAPSPQRSTWEFATKESKGKEFVAFNTRYVANVTVYALETATVEIYLWPEQTAPSTKFLVDTVTLAAGETRNVWFDPSHWTTNDNLNHVVATSTGDILMFYFANDGVTDQIVVEPLGHEFYGAGGGAVKILNFDYCDQCTTTPLVQLDCDNQHKTSYWHTVSQGFGQGSGQFNSPPCRVYSAGRISAQTFGDGDGGNGVSWVPSSRFGTLGAISEEAELLKIVGTNSATVCTIGSTDYIMATNDDAAFTDAYDIRALGPFPVGTVVTCTEPVMIIFDAVWVNDESNLHMWTWTDPCSLCPTVVSPVCASGLNYDNECLARCLGETSVEFGHCETSAPSTSPSVVPSLSPTTAPPSQSPTTFPSTSPTTTIPLYTNTQAVGVLKNLLAENTRQTILQQAQTEHNLRSSGSSGMTLVRAYRDGTRVEDADGGILNGGLLQMHDHPNFDVTLGLGEFGAILNGVRFDTRHNDYKLSRPADNANDRSKYNELVEIEWPGVPSSVQTAGNVDDQVAEMKKYWEAWKKQDDSILPDGVSYKDYFQANLCYLEGAWIYQDSDDLTEPFDSDRHEIEQDTWSELNDAMMFRAASGKKQLRENVPFLPKKIVDVRYDHVNAISYPVYANYEYRIACQPLAEDLPTGRFLVDIDENVLAKAASGSHTYQREDMLTTRKAHFKINDLRQDKWETNESKDRTQLPPISSRNGYLDELMKQIPGKDGPNGNLVDDAFEMRCTEWGDLTATLNTGFYSRYFQFDAEDAMGRQQQMRGYQDLNMFGAMTDHEEVVAQTVCDDNFQDADGETKCWTQRWTNAVPLEVVYTTPLNNWNPCNLEEFDDASAWNAANVGKDGTEGNPYVGFTRKGVFNKTPMQFYHSQAGEDLADTGTGHWAVGTDGTKCYVVSSGTKIVTDPVLFAGDSEAQGIRLRWPIFPIHDHSRLAFREVSALGKHVRQEMKTENDELRLEISALKDLVQQLADFITDASDFTSLQTDVVTLDFDEEIVVDHSDEEMVGKYTESTYPQVMFTTGPGYEDHIHSISCDWLCFRDLMAMDPVEIETEEWDGHDHVLTIQLVQSTSGNGNDKELIFISCANCDGDPHSYVTPDASYPELFVDVRRN